jgi:hypothetical protein
MLRLQYGPKQDSRVIIRQLAELCDESPVEEIAFFIYGEELNYAHETHEGIERWLAGLRPIRKALEKMGIAVSLNPWHSLLHGDRNRSLKPGQNWQRMVDWTGRESQAMICPLDESWRDYFAVAMHQFAAEGYAAIWIDDDIRYHNHVPLEWGGCWCPLHIAAFNQAANADVTRAELIEALLQPGPVHPWRELWLDLWNRQQCELLYQWREIVERKGSRLALMTSDIQLHASEGRHWPDVWNAIAGNKPPIIRPAYWPYTDVHGSFFIYSISQMQLNQIVQPEHSMRYAEIENFRYGQWNKPFVQIASQMAMAQVFGCEGLAVSLYDFMGNLPGDTPSNATFIRKSRPFLEKLASFFTADMKSVGIGIPWRPDVSRKCRLDESDPPSWKSLIVPTNGWGFWLGGMGLAFQKQTSETTNALSGKMAWAFEDEVIETMLSRGLLLDGPAAEIFYRRGWGEQIGLSNPRFHTQKEMLFSVEESLDESFGLREGARMSINLGGYSHQMLQGELAEQARLISVLLDPAENRVGHGGWVYENSLGGCVAVVPWAALPGSNPFEGIPPLCVQREVQLAKVIDWLTRHQSIGRACGHPWLISQFLHDGDAWRAVIWNGSPDPISTFQMDWPTGMKRIEQALHGQVDKCAFGEVSVCGQTIHTARPMRQWDFIMLSNGA